MGSTPIPEIKPDIQALRQTIARIEAKPVLDAFSAVESRTEVPICGKTWWEDGEQWECLMDAGHREQKHGLRGMVRKLQA